MPKRVVKKTVVKKTPAAKPKPVAIAKQAAIAKPVAKSRKAEPPRLVYCPGCDRQQPDLGLRNSCERCGLGPIPSYSYPPDSVFHPDRAGRKSKPIFAHARTT